MTEPQQGRGGTAEPLPREYAWLAAVEGRPLMVVEALALYGTHEVPGTGDNPSILAWAVEVGLGAVYRHDAVAWCGLFMAVVAKRAGKPVPASPLWALNWGGFGVPSPAPALGDVLTFRRPGGGHVGLYIGEDGEAFHVLAGNQGDRVSIARLARGRLSAARRPAYRVQPAGVRPYRLAPTGAPSTNEA